jgi:hypothetical protein
LIVGVMAAVVAWLKLVLVIVVAAVVIAVLLVESLSHVPFDFRRWLVRFGVAGAGFVCGSTILLLPLWLDGSLGHFLEASWSYPRAALPEITPAPLERLFRAALRALVLLAPFACLALYGLSQRRKERAEWLLWGWLLAAATAIVLQRFSWWAYQMTVLFVPVALLGLLATRYLNLNRWLGSAGAFNVSCVAVALSICVAAFAGWRKSIDLPAGLFASTPTARYEFALAPGYEQLRMLGERYQRQVAESNTLCVFGDPALLFHARARCPMTISVWSEPAMNEDKWRQMATQLRRARPDVVYLARSTADLLMRRQPEIAIWLEANYVYWQRGQGDDVWLRRKDFVGVTN